VQKRKSKKINKLRGNRSSGYGYTKGHRAAGQRGGKGMAGSEKHHKMKILKENPRYFGKWGFKRPQQVIRNVEAVNIGTIDEAADRMIERGEATISGKKYTIDVSKLGIDRILGSGKVTRKLNIVGVKSITPAAREKITKAGGSIDLPEE
jgi:large subunit ribosomal protein L15